MDSGDVLDSRRAVPGVHDEEGLPPDFASVWPALETVHTRLLDGNGSEDSAPPAPPHHYHVSTRDGNIHCTYDDSIKYHFGVTI